MSPDPEFQSENPFEDPASLRRGNFTYFPVIPGRLEFAIEVRRAILRERPPIVAVELPGSLEDVYLQTLARLAGDDGDSLSGSKRRRARHLCARGAVRSVHRSRAHRARNRRRGDFHRARFGRPAASSRYLSRSLFDPLHRPEQIHRRLSRLSAASQRGNRGARGGHGVEAARRRSAGAGVCGCLAQSCWIRCWTPWRCRKMPPRARQRRPISGC